MNSTYIVLRDANRNGGIAAVHRAGCSAIIRDTTRATVTTSVLGTLRDALDVAVDEQDRELGYTDNDAHVHNCANDRHEGGGA